MTLQVHNSSGVRLVNQTTSNEGFEKTASYLTLGKSFSIEVWVPNLKLGKNEVPEGFIATEIRIGLSKKPIAIDSQKLAEFCANQGLDISQNAIRTACSDNRLKEFVSDIAHQMHVRRVISRYPMGKWTEKIIDYVIRNYPVWKQECGFHQRIVTHSFKGVFFEYVPDEISAYFLYKGSSIDSFVVHFPTEEICRFTEYDRKISAKIASFAPLFNENVGLIRFYNIFDHGNKRSIGKYTFYDFTLDCNEVHRSKPKIYQPKDKEKIQAMNTVTKPTPQSVRSIYMIMLATMNGRAQSTGKSVRGIDVVTTTSKAKTKPKAAASTPSIKKSTNTLRARLTPRQSISVALQILSGFKTLKKEGIVHLGLFPLSLCFQSVGPFNTKVLAFITNFQYAHKVDKLPTRMHLPTLWHSYIPPELEQEGALLKSHPDPFAISIFQLGLCFKELFKAYQTRAWVKPVIDGMTQKNPSMRWLPEDVEKVLRIEIENEKD